MSVILVDLADESHDLQLNWWNWRPIRAFLHARIGVEEDQFDRMSCNGRGGQLAPAQAAQAACALRQEVLARMGENDRLYLEGEIDVARATPQERVDYNSYAATRSAIGLFVAFCEKCGGFEVM